MRLPCSLVSIAGFSALLMFFFSKRIMKSLHDFAQSIENAPHFQGSDFKFPVELSDEVGTLARALNRKTKLLEKLALFDSLTGLPNRKSLVEHMEKSIHTAQQHATFMAVFFFDLNKFKLINDDYGHDYGDELLIKFAQRLKGRLRNDCFCARLSGDEFCIIVDNYESKIELDKIINNLEMTLNDSYEIKGVILNMTISGGVAIYPKHGESGPLLLKHADEAMYASKKEGKGKIKIYQPKT